MCITRQYVCPLYCAMSLMYDLDFLYQMTLTALMQVTLTLVVLLS